MKISDKAKSIYIGFELFFDGSYGIEPNLGPRAYDTYGMGVTKIYYDEENQTLHVAVRRPGMLIGKGGSTIAELEKYLGCNVHIHEVRNLYTDPKDPIVCRNF